MTLAWVALTALRWLTTQPVAWVWVGLWCLALGLDKQFSVLHIADASSFSAGTSYHASFQLLLLGGALGLLATGTLRPLWGRAFEGRDLARCALVLCAPVLPLLLVQALFLGLPASGSMGRHAPTFVLVLLAGGWIARLPATAGNQVIVWLGVTSALAWLIPSWFAPDAFLGAHPLGSPVLPILGLMLASWLSAPARGLDR